MSESTPPPAADNTDWLRDLNAVDLQRSFDEVDIEIPAPEHASLLNNAEALLEDLEHGHSLAAVGTRILAMTQLVASLVPV